MKNINTILKTIIALLFAAAVIASFAVSCSLNGADGKGTLKIKMPGNNSARALSDEYLGSLTYTLDFTSSGKSQSKKAAAGETVTITLAAGSWNIDVKVFNSDGKPVGSAETTTVNVEVGVITPVTIYVTINPGENGGSDNSGYFGNTMNLTGQVYIYKTDGADNFIGYEEYKSGSEIRFTSYVGGSGTISTTGMLYFEIGVPSPADLEPIEDFFTIYKEDSFNGTTAIHDYSITFSPSDVKGAHITSFDDIAEGLSLFRELLEIGNNRQEYVSYFYVNKDVKITISDASEYLFGASLDLKSGWNAFHLTYSESKEDSRIRISVSNPDRLKWVLDKFDEESDPGDHEKPWEPVDPGDPWEPVDPGAKQFQEGWPTEGDWRLFGLYTGLLRPNDTGALYSIESDGSLTVVLSGDVYEDIINEFENNISDGNGEKNTNQGNGIIITEYKKIFFTFERYHTMLITEYWANESIGINSLRDILTGIIGNINNNLNISGGKLILLVINNN